MRENEGRGSRGSERKYWLGNGSREREVLAGTTRRVRSRDGRSGKWGERRVE